MQTERGNIDFAQIRTTARQGNGVQFQMYSGGSAPTAGHAAVFDSQGNVIDGGVAPGGGGGGAVSSVFGRTGAVVASSGDYTAAQVTNAVDQTSSYANPAWITSLPWSKITGAPATGVSSVFGRTGAVVASSGDYTAAQITNAVDQTGSYANPVWITSLAWSKITGAPSVVSYQTPWLSNIDGGNFYLSDAQSIRIGATGAPACSLDIHGAAISVDSGIGSGVWAECRLWGPNTANNRGWRMVADNSGSFGIEALNSDTNLGIVSRVITSTRAGNVAIGNNGATLPDSNTGDVRLILGSTATSVSNQINLVANSTSTQAGMGAISFANYAVSATEKRISAIVGATDISGGTGAGILLFYTSSGSGLAERIRILGGGNVGIGTSAPTSQLHLYGTGQGSTGISTSGALGGSIILQDSGGSGMNGGAVVFGANQGMFAAIKGLISNGGANTAGHISFQTRVSATDATLTEAMKIISNGLVGIGGTTTFDAMLNIQTPTIPATVGSREDSLDCISFATNGQDTHIRIYASVFSAATTGWDGFSWKIQHTVQSTNMAYIEFNPGPTTGSQALAFGSGSNEYVRIINGGYVGIGTNAPTYMLHLNADSAAKPSTNTWTISSDIRTKRNVHRFEGDIEVIRRLDPIAGEYNGLAGTPEGMRVVSFDAAKLREIVPQCVSSVRGKLRQNDPEETDILGVNTHEIFFHMLRAIQQIDARLNALEQIRNRN